ncbi:MAG: hypothetical protein AAGI30_13970, partial [Planctomycetota bacterium]
YIRTPTKRKIGLERFNAIASAAGIAEVDRRNVVEITLPKDDPKLNKIKSILHENGLSPWRGTGRHDRASQYDCILRREWSIQDLNAASLLRCLGGERGFCYASARDPAGVVVMPILAGVTPLREDRAIFASIPRWMFADAALCEVLESGGLTGLVFEGTRAVRSEDKDQAQRDLEVPSVPGEIWKRLDSSIELPPVSPSNPKLNIKREPAARGDRERVLVLDAENPDIKNPQLRYLRSELDAVPEFDVAKMYEAFGLGQELIVSQRFRQVCLEHQIDCVFEPVMIEEDR